MDIWSEIDASASTRAADYCYETHSDPALSHKLRIVLGSNSPAGGGDTGNSASPDSSSSSSLPALWYKGPSIVYRDAGDGEKEVFNLAKLLAAAGRAAAAAAGATPGEFSSDTTAEQEAAIEALRFPTWGAKGHSRRLYPPASGQAKQIEPQ
jgi:hypothetical protein